MIVFENTRTFGNSQSGVAVPPLYGKVLSTQNTPYQPEHLSIFSSGSSDQFGVETTEPN